MDYFINSIVNDAKKENFIKKRNYKKEEKI